MYVLSTKKCEKTRDPVISLREMSKRGHIGGVRFTHAVNYDRIDQLQNIQQTISYDRN